MTQVKASANEAGIIAKDYFSKRRLTNYLLIITFIFFLAMLLMRVMTVYSLNYDLVGVETNVVYSVQSVLAGQSLYNDPMYVPFTITQYTPLYYQICTITASLLNLNPATDIHEIYTVGRFWNIIFNFLTVYAVYLICRNIFLLDKSVSLIAGLSAFVFIFRHDFSFRPDSLQNLFVLWAIYLFFLYLQHIHRKNNSVIYLVGAMFLGVTSIFAKQSGIQIPIIFLMFLLFIKDWRSFIIAATVSVVSFGAYYLYYSQLYGEAFYQNVVGGVANGISLQGFLMWVVGAKPFLLKIFIPFLIVSYCIIKYNLLFKGTPEERFLAFSLGGLFVFASVTGLKTGATAQYYSLFQYVAWIFIFYYFVKKQEYIKENFKTIQNAYIRRYSIWFYLIALLAVNTFYQFFMIKNDEIDGKSLLVKEKQITQEIASFVKEDLSIRPGEKVFANLRLAYRKGINNALFEYCVAPQIEIVYYPQTTSKVFGYAQFDESLRNGKIKYIIESDPKNQFKITDNYELLRESKFKLVKKIENYLIYQYKE